MDASSTSSINNGSYDGNFTADNTGTCNNHGNNNAASTSICNSKTTKTHPQSIGETNTTDYQHHAQLQPVGTGTTGSNGTRSTCSSSDSNEEVLFAAMNIEMVDQTVYEEAVIQDATVPQLSSNLLSLSPNNTTGTTGSSTKNVTNHGFPKDLVSDLIRPITSVQEQRRMEHASSTTTTGNSGSDAVPVLPTTSQILQSIVSSNEKQLNQGVCKDVNHDSSNKRKIILQMKEQILLHLLESLSHQNKTRAIGNNRKQSEQHRTRIPMMKRRRMDNSENQENDEKLSKQQTHLLKELRNKRILKRQQMQQQLQQRGIDAADDASNSSGVSTSSSDENEHDFAVTNEVIDSNTSSSTTSNQITTVNNTMLSSQTTAQQQGTSEQLVDENQGRQVTCPICDKEISISNTQDDVDSTLAAHMQTCQKKDFRRITRRRTNLQQSTSEILSNSSNNLNNDITNSKKIKKMKLKQNKYDDTMPKPIDDMNENDYEDRVDDWIIHGISNMKVMKERDIDDDEYHNYTNGIVEFDDNFYIHAWIYQHLFSYQRDGIKWIYNLHQQNLGGIIGDEMGLVCMTVRRFIPLFLLFLVF